MPIPEIAAALASASHASTLLRGLHKLARDSEVNAAVIGLQQSILDLQTKIFEIQAKHEEVLADRERLSHKLDEKKAWAATAGKYELRELADGIFVYALKAGPSGSEPAHYLCPHCFQDRKVSIMHRPGVGWTNFVCHVCKLEVRPVASASAEIVGMRRSSRLEGL